MSNNNIVISRSGNLDIIRDALNGLEKGRGRVICITGESGFGKSRLLQDALNEIRNKKLDVNTASTECQAPIGNFTIGDIQPLQPFNSLMQKLLAGGDLLSAKQRLTKNLLLTTLASIPIIDTFFYAMKEAGRDLKQYRKEKEEEKGDGKSVTSNYFDALSAYAEKKPLVLFIDDAHWVDAQSVELLDRLTAEVSRLNIILFLSYTPSLLQRRAVPLSTWSDKHLKSNPNVLNIDLKILKIEEISALAKSILINYRQNSQFESWILEQSYGVPGVVTEYLRYFKKNTPFDSEGNLKDDFEKADYLPSSVSAAFSDTLNELSEEERNLLSICSAEGREFTALIVSELLNTDILTTIRKLRALQNKTGFISSIGAQLTYGVKTTKYRFTKAFYHQFFEKSLEYEEHVALHGQIAALLKQKYEETEDESVKEAIAPYLAAHSAESGDEETTRSMLLISAKTAGKYGNADIVKTAYERFNGLNLTKEMVAGESALEGSSIDSEDIAFREILSDLATDVNELSTPKSDVSSADNENENNELSNNNNNASEGLVSFTEFNTLRKAIVADFHKSKYSEIVDLVNRYMDNHADMLSPSQFIQLYSFAGRAAIESGKLDLAEDFINKAYDLKQKKSDNLSTAMLFNADALLLAKRKNYSEAFLVLKKLAKKAIQMPPEIRLLTIANIALILKESSPNESGPYLEVARKMTNDLKFDHLASDLNR